MSIDPKCELAMRVFVGLSVPWGVQAAMDQLVIEAGVEHAHHSQDRHMTLFFLGNVDDEQLINLSKDIQGLKDKKTVKWSSNQLGPFPSVRKPKVWALEGDITASLLDLRHDLAELPAMEALLKCRNSHGFRPHVSLSRSRSVHQAPSPCAIQISFNRLGIFKSDTTGGDGPKYTEVVGWDLE